MYSLTSSWRGRAVSEGVAADVVGSEFKEHGNNALLMHYMHAQLVRSRLRLALPASLALPAAAAFPSAGARRGPRCRGAIERQRASLCVVNPAGLGLGRGGGVEAKLVETRHKEFQMET